MMPLLINVAVSLALFGASLALLIDAFGRVFP